MTPKKDQESVPFAPLAVLVLLALGLGLLGSGYGLPYGVYPDEGFFAARAWGIAHALRAGRLSLNPGDFLYPSFLYYLLAAWQLACGSASVFGPAVLREGRLLMAAIGAATVALLGRSAGRAFGSKVGLLAAFFLALSSPLLDSMRRINPDGLLTLLMLSCLAGLWDYRRSGSKVSLLAAGAAAGGAAGAKYLGFIMLVPAAIAIAGKERTWSGRLRLLAAFGGASALVFAVASPYCLLDASAFRRDIERQFMNQSTGQVAFVSSDPLYYLRSSVPVLNDPALANSLRGSLGLAFLAAAAGGLVIGLRRRQPEAGLAAALMIPYFLLISLAASKQLRFALPIVPVLCLFAALLVNSAPDSWRRVLSLALALGLALPAVAHVRALAGNDSRILASRWLDRTLPPGASVLLTPLYGPFPSPGRFQVRVMNLPQYGWEVRLWSPAVVDRILAERDDYSVLSSWYELPHRAEAEGGPFAPYSRDVVGLFDRLRSGGRRLVVFGPGLPGPRLEVYKSHIDRMGKGS